VALRGQVVGGQVGNRHGGGAPSDRRSSLGEVCNQKLELGVALPGQVQRRRASQASWVSWTPASVAMCSTGAAMSAPRSRKGRDDELGGRCLGGAPAGQGLVGVR
jgi:hypothetical protein